MAVGEKVFFLGACVFWGSIGGSGVKEVSGLERRARRD
jgi:hypothetical protein